MRILRKFQKSIRVRGILGTAIVIVRMTLGIPKLIQEYRSQSKRNRIQDEFDATYGTDTGGIIPLSNFAIDNPVWMFGARYGPTSPTRFLECLRLLPVTADQYGKFAFMDLGSGKGATLLYACDAGFRTAVGVELSKQLHETGMRNITLYPTARDRASLVCGDATRCDIVEGPVVIFIHCLVKSEQLVDDALANISAKRSGEVYILYEDGIFDLTMRPAGREFVLLAHDRKCRAYHLR